MSGSKTGTSKTTPWALWKSMITDRSGLSSIETAIMFGVFAVGFALIAAPFVEKKAKQFAANDTFFGEQVDNVVTGSIPRRKQFTIRRSVLQSSKTSQCIIFDDGRKVGDCK